MIVLRDKYEIVSTGKSRCPSDYHVTFRMNDKCNLSCEYCRWYDGDNYKHPMETLDALFAFFSMMGYKNVTLYFHGGEATIHPKILDTLTHIRRLESEYNIKTYVEYQTNLAYSLDTLRNILPYIDMLSISYHYIDLVRTDNHDIFVDNFNYLKENGIQIERFDIMLENVEDDQIQTFYNNILWFLGYKGIVDSEMIHGFCKYSKNPITKQKHIDFYNKYNKTEQKYRVDGVEYNTNDLFEQGLNCEGCRCNAGTNDIMLNADGNVFACGVEMTYWRMGCKDSIKPITNILTDVNHKRTLKMRTMMKTICRYDYCGGDFYIQKWK